MGKEDDNISSGWRVIHTGISSYDRFFARPKLEDKVAIKNGDVEQTIHLMMEVVWKYGKQQTALISRHLKSGTKTDYEVCSRIWKFLHDNIQYRLDDAGQEQLRTPNRSWSERAQGIDCDCFSVFVSSILTNLNISHSFRITKYGGKQEFQHVYVIAHSKDKGDYIIDCVLHQFNHEKTYSQKRDYIMSLNGIDIAVLSGHSGNNNMSRLSEVLFFEAFKGLGAIKDPAKMKEYLIVTNNQIKADPSAISAVENPAKFIEMLDYAIKHWDNKRLREQAVAILIKNEERASDVKKSLGYLSDAEEDDDGIEGYDDINDIDEYLDGVMEDLGKTKAQRKENKQQRKEKKKEKKEDRKEQKQDKKEKKQEKKEQKKQDKQAGKKTGFFKKVGAALKTGGNAFIRFNPITISARNGFLLFMRTNIKKAASNLKWAYATQAEATAKGITADNWNKSKSALAKIEQLFVKTLQGKADKLKNAILKGKAGGLSGWDLEEEYTLSDIKGLGDPATGAMLAAAAPVIIATLKILSDAGLMSKGEADNISSELAAMANDPSVESDARLVNDEGGNDDDDNESTANNPVIDWIKENALLTTAIVGGVATGVYFLTRKKKPANSKTLSGLSKKKLKSASKINKVKVLQLK